MTEAMYIIAVVHGGPLVVCTTHCVETLNLLLFLVQTRAEQEKKKHFVFKPSREETHGLAKRDIGSAERAKTRE